jgi:hypothetical protein
MKTALKLAWFRQWFRLMPREWQAGFHCAMNGGAWRGDFETADWEVECVVMFLSPELAERVEDFLANGAK